MTVTSGHPGDVDTCTRAVLAEVAEGLAKGECLLNIRWSTDEDDGDPDLVAGSDRHRTSGGVDTAVAWRADTALPPADAVRVRARNGLSGARQSFWSPARASLISRTSGNWRTSSPHAATTSNS
jgi:hypothetical protein